LVLNKGRRGESQTGDGETKNDSCQGGGKRRNIVASKGRKTKNGGETRIKCRKIRGSWE